MYKDLSIGIISLNAEKTIEKTFESCKELGNFILVDNGSKDNTLNIAKTYKAEIYTLLTKDQRKLREYLLSKAKTKWVLFLDTDEIIDRKSLGSLIKTWESKKNIYSGFWLIRRNYYGEGQNDYLKYGLFYPDYQLRLVRSNIKYKNTPHEEPDIEDDKTYKLKDAYISHYFNKSKLFYPFGFLKLMEFTRSYATHLTYLPIYKLFFIGIWRFIDLSFISLIRGKGILDGIKGIMSAFNFGIHIASIYFYAIYLKVKIKRS